MTDKIIHRDRPDLAPDGVEVAIVGVNTHIFTLILSAEKKAAWVEIEGNSDKILITFPIEKVAEVIMAYVAAERRKKSDDVMLEKLS
jgi:hypothetical protein